MGDDEIANGIYSCAIGEDNSVTGNDGFAFGWANNITKDECVTIGGNNSITANNGIAIGNSNVTNGLYSIVLGAGVNDGSNPLTDNIDNSLFVGFNSNIPTLFVGTSSGEGTIGRVGVGTTSPSAVLHISSNSGYSEPQVQITQQNDADWTRLRFDAAGEDYFDLSYGGSSTYSPGVFNIFSSAISHNCFSVQSGGNVGVNTIIPAQLFSVNDGNILITNDNTTSGQLQFMDPSGHGSITSFEAGNQGSTYNVIRYILPTSPPTATNYILEATTFTSPYHLQWGPCCDTGGIIGNNGGDSILPATVKAQQQIITQQSAELSDLTTRVSQLESQIQQLTGGQSNSSQQAIQSQITASVQIVPNPFSNSTTVSYYLTTPVAGAQLLISNASSGIAVALFNISNKITGSIVIDGGNLAPGTYRCSIVSGNQIFASQNMILVK